MSCALSIDRQNCRCPRYRYSILRASKYRFASPDRWPGYRRGGGWMERRRRTKLVRRARNGSSPYFCDSSRPVHPSGSGSHYRSMDGRGWERGKGLVQHPRAPSRPAVPFLPCTLLASLRRSSRSALFRSCLPLSRSLAAAPAFSLTPASVTCSSALTVFVI